jgi:hemerythrin superfamily protein
MAEDGRESVVDLLVRQHQQIRDQFAKVVKESGLDKAEAFDMLRYLLTVHESAEQEVLHPFARRAIGDGARVVEARLTEEKEAKDLLQQLEMAGTDSVDFEPLLERLQRAVQAHAEQEEQVEFPEITQTATPQQLQEMAAAVKAAEAAAATRPHPGAEPAKIVAGPGSDGLGD